MREILFRGKRIDNGEWVEGWYQPPIVGIHCDGRKESLGASLSIIGNYGFLEDVYIIPETVGQFTGLTDKNGKKVFEGDIIRSDNGKQWAVSVVKFGEYVPKMFYRMLDMFSPGRKHLPSVGFYAKTVDKGEEMILFQSPCMTVIGNIHDNPELLEVTDNA